MMLAIDLRTPQLYLKWISIELAANSWEGNYSGSENIVMDRLILNMLCH